MTRKVQDPVCGMTVEPNQAAGQSEHEGETYYFCSKDCKRAFDQNPSSYVGNQPMAGSRP
jgi:Cu+-exporting ATPase